MSECNICDRDGSNSDFHVIDTYDGDGDCHKINVCYYCKVAHRLGYITRGDEAQQQ